MIIIIFLGLIITVAGTYISAAFFYPYIRPYLNTASNRKLLIRNVVIFIIIAWGSGGLVWYLNREPAYFEQGVKQLHTNTYVVKKIQAFNSYLYYGYKLKDQKSGKAMFQIGLINDSVTLYLTCTMINTHNHWYLAKIDQDSIVKKL